MNVKEETWKKVKLLLPIAAELFTAASVVRLLIEGESTRILLAVATLFLLLLPFAAEYLV